MSTRLGWTFHVDYQPWSDARRLFIARRGAWPERGRQVIEPLVARTVEDGLPYDIPTLAEVRTDVEDGIGDVENFLQAALEAAWALGMRPQGFKDRSDELTAVRYHLEDMRALAKVPAR